MSIETQCIYHKFAKNKNPPLSSYSTTPYSNIPHRLHSFSITNQHLRICFKTPLISQCQHILTAGQIFKLKLNKFFHSSCSYFCFLVFCILCSFIIVLVLFFAIFQFYNCPVLNHVRKFLRNCKIWPHCFLRRL